MDRGLALRGKVIKGLVLHYQLGPIGHGYQQIRLEGGRILGRNLWQPGKGLGGLFEGRITFWLGTLGRLVA